MGIKNIIAFEADHNGGKWSQIWLLSELAEVLGREVITTRGAIYREGSWKTIWDPKSSYWQKRMKAYPLVDHMTTAERFDFEKENTIRLRRELNIGLNRILAHTEKDILLVLDRSEISGYFWLKKLFSSLTFEEYLSFKDSKGHSTEIIKPDMIFALQVSKEELLKRNAERGESNSSRNRERYTNIANHHELFEETLQVVENFFPLQYIDWERPAQEIHQEIKDKLGQLWLL